MQMGQKAAANNMTKKRAADGDLRETAQGDDPVCQMSFTERHINELEAADPDKQDVEPAIQKKFNLAMGGVIIGNIFWIAIEMDFGPEEGVPVSKRIGWFLINSLFLALFCFEILVRLHWERSKWPFHFWNWFDTFVVLSAVIDTWLLPVLESQTGSLHVLPILRLARLIRLVRMVKLVKNLHSLYVMVMAFLHALKSMMFLGCIMFFGMLIYSILATVVIGKNSTFEDVRIYEDSVDDRFGKVYRSMYSLFELMTLEGWQMVARPLVEKQPLCFLFIGSYIMIFTYGMLNMVVATVVEKTLEQTASLKEFDSKKELRNLRTELNGMKTMFMDGDADHNGSLTQDEFKAALLANDSLKESLLSLGIPYQDVSELFHVLDLDCNDELTIEELVDGVGKLKGGSLSVWDGLSTQANVKNVKTDVTQLQERVRAVTLMQANMEARLVEQGDVLKQLMMCVSGEQAPPLPPNQILDPEMWY